MNPTNDRLARWGGRSCDAARSADAGFVCPDHGVTVGFRTVVGSLLPLCHRCDRVVTQVEATSESF